MVGFDLIRLDVWVFPGVWVCGICDLVSVRLFGLVCRVAPFGVIWGLVGLFWLGGVNNCWWFGLVLVGFVVFGLV